MLGEFDLSILRALQDIRTPLLNIIFEYLSKIGEAPVAIVFVSFIYYVLDKEFGIKLLYLFGGACTFNNSVKNICKVQRAFRIESSGISCVYPDTATGYSFPSGHSQQISVSTFSIAHHYKKIWIYVIAIILSILVAFSRVYLGCHYASDVVIGLIIGLLWAFVGNILYDKVGKDKIFLFSIILFSVLGIIFFFDPRFGEDFNITQTSYFKDMYSSLAILVGGYIGLKIENKYVNFDNKVISFKKKFLRWILAAAMMGVIYLGLSLLFKLDLFKTNPYIVTICSFVKYVIVITFIVGIAPIILRKVK